MITLGTTAPPGAAANAMGAGFIYVCTYTLSGAPAGSYFSAIRLRTRNNNSSTPYSLRGVVYDNSNHLVDWAQYGPLPPSAPDQIVSIPLTGAVVVTNGTYKFGIQTEASDVHDWIHADGSFTISYRTSGSWGTTPPTSLSPDGTIAYQLAAEADVASPGVTPVANFTGTPTTGTASLSVTFTDSSTNTPTSWAWTFGDGGTSTSQNPSHSYTTSGVYTVTLVATNSGGSDTKTRTAYISVSEAISYAAGGGIFIY